MHHKQVSITVYDPGDNSEETIEVDEEIAPLIETLHKIGVNTWFSCQGNKRTEKIYGIGKGYILFPEVADVLQMMNLVSELDSKQPLSPMNRPAIINRVAKLSGIMPFELGFNSSFYDDEAESHIPCFDSHVSCTFHNKDLKEITKIFKEVLNNK